MAMAMMTPIRSLSPACCSSSSQSVGHDETGTLLKFNGLRRHNGQMKFQSSRQGRKAFASGVVHATSLRPRRLLREEGELIPVSPEDSRVDYVPGELKVASFSAKSLHLVVSECAAQT